MMLCLLGPPAVRVGNVVTPLKLRPKALALLAHLAIEGPLPRATLADLIFPQAEAPRAALRWHVNYLRTSLPTTLREQLVVTQDKLALEIPTDVAAFDKAARRLVECPDDPAARDVLALYRGDLCAGVTASASAVFDTWLYVRQESLRRVFRQATVAVARHALAASDAEAAVEPLAQLVSVDPYFEEGHTLLIAANEALGRRQPALTAYQRYQRILRRELQVEPPFTLVERYEPGVPANRTLPLDNLVPLEKLTLNIVDWTGVEPAILAIHGSTMSAHSFTGLAEQLAPDARFVSVDLRGHGFSDKPPAGYSVDQHVDDLCELIAILGLERPVILGFSMGGAIATFLATRVECSGLILLDGVVGDRAFTENAAAVVMPAQRAALAQRLGGFDEYLAQWRASVFATGWSDGAERILERTIRYDLAPLPDGRYRRRTLMAAFEESWASVLQADSLSALGRVRCPTLIVHATRPWIGGKPYLSDAVIAAQLKAARRAQLFVARHSSHPMLPRAPEADMVTRLKDFIHSLRGAAGATQGSGGLPTRV